MTTHEIKCYPEYYQDLVSGIKTFEVRKNDRDYQVGDVLHIYEFDGLGYTGNHRMFQVTYILTGGRFGIEPDYVVMAVIPFKI
jgi:uncharacterized protein YqfB (UPF0267 family)